MRFLITLFVATISISCFGQYSEALLKKAEKGFVNSQLELAKCYIDGNGVDESQAEALKWFEKAAENNNIEAMVACGDLLFDEWNVDLEPDYVRGFKWYRKAAAKGNKKAIDCISNWEAYIDSDDNITDCPYTWLPCDEDLDRCAFLKENLDRINKGADNKNPIAIYYLAVIAYGNKNYSSAVKYLNEIYPLVINEDNYYEDILDQEENKIPIGASIGAKVFSLLGWCYEHGQGIDQDFVKAAEYYLTDFDYTAFGMSMIPKVRGAYCYKKANLIDKFINEVETQTFCLIGACNRTLYHIPWLQLKLAEMYMIGDGVSINKKKTLEIYESIVDSRKDLIILLWGWYPEFRSYSDVGEAAYRAAKMYRSGEGCKPDEDMGDLYFDIALKYGNKSAWRERQKQ